MYTSQEARISCPAVSAKVKFLALGNIMVFGFELKLCRLLQKYSPLGVTEVFSPTSLILIQKWFDNSEYFKQTNKHVLDFQSKKGFKLL